MNYFWTKITCPLYAMTLNIPPHFLVKLVDQMVNEKFL